MRMHKWIFFPVLVFVMSGFCLQGQTRKVSKSPGISTIQIRDVAVSISKSSKGMSGIHAAVSPLTITVRNWGNVDLKNVVVHLYLKPGKSMKFPMIQTRPYLERSIKNLAAGESRRIELTSPNRLKVTPVPGGRYRLIVMADPLNQIKEKDENNNRAECNWVIMARITEVRETPTGESYGGELFPEITLFGERFGSPGPLRMVHIGASSPGSTPAFPHDWKDTRIFMGLGPSMPCGVYVVFLSDSGVRISNRVNFLLKCWISELLPMAGASPGAEVEIHGRNFGAAQDGRVVTMGSATAAVISWSSNNIRIQVPALAPGIYKVHVKKGGVDYSGGMDYRVL